jgi:hypothetical protein
MEDEERTLKLNILSDKRACNLRGRSLFAGVVGSAIDLEDRGID